MGFKGSFFFKTVNLPEGNINLCQGETIVDAEKFVQSHILIVQTNNGNKVYKPYYDRLLKGNMPNVKKGKMSFDDLTAKMATVKEHLPLTSDIAIQQKLNFSPEGSSIFAKMLS